MKLDILGTGYEIKKLKWEEEPVFDKRGIDGYCDDCLKQIVYCDMATYPKFQDETKEYCESCERHTLRHEIVHAFLTESGLSDSSACFQGGWAINEEMVDWMALQGEKIYKAWQEAGCIG